MNNKPILGDTVELDHFLARDIIAFFVLNEDIGIKINDAAQKGNMGILSNTSWVPNYAESGKVLSFNGATSFGDISLVAKNDVFAGPHTMSGRFRLASWASSQTIIGASPLGLSVPYSILSFDTATKRFTVRVNDGGENIVASINTYDNDSDWHDFSYSVNTSGHITQFVLDKVLQGTTSTNRNLTGCTDCLLGQLPWSSPNVNVLDGDIEHIVIHARELTFSEAELLSDQPWTVFEHQIDPGIYGVVTVPAVGNVGALLNAGLLKGKLCERLFQC